MGRLSLKLFLIILAAILVLITIFSLIDYFAHSLSEEYSVPGRYFTNKMIFGTLIAFFSYLALRSKSLILKSLFVSALTSLLLQLRYFIEGYSVEFVILFLFIHFLILFPFSIFIFWLLKKYFFSSLN